MASNRAHWGPSLVRVLACLLACAPQPTLTLPRPDAAAPAMMGAKIAQCGGATRDSVWRQPRLTLRGGLQEISSLTSETSFGPTSLERPPPGVAGGPSAAFLGKSCWDIPGLNNVAGAAQQQAMLNTRNLVFFVGGIVALLLGLIPIMHSGEGFYPPFPGLHWISTKAFVGIPVDDRLPRFPNWTAAGMIRLFDYVGSAACAWCGCLAAGERGMDLIGCLIMAQVTTVGGGTFRDLMIGHENGVSKRAFWMGEPEYLAIGLGTGVFTFFFWNLLVDCFNLSQDDAFFFWWDTVGISAFCVIGAMHGIRAGLHPFIVAMCGMFSASFGGLTRDVISRHPVRIMHNHAELYAAPAFFGAAAYVLARSLGAPLGSRIAAGFWTCMVLRAACWFTNFRLPTMGEVKDAKKRPDLMATPQTTPEETAKL